MWALLTAPILPYAYAPLAERFVSRLSELAQHDVPDIDMAGAAERARVFQALAARLDASADDWRARPADVDAERTADVLNRTMLALSHILIPAAATVVGPYGQDRYGHSWQ